MLNANFAANPIAPFILAAGTAFVLCTAFYPVYIRWLRSRQMQQYIREEGPKSHAVKAKTPTMGGLCFIAAISISFIATLSFQEASLLGGKDAVRAYLVLAVAVLCGLLGFADDFGKITSKSNAGISGKLRLICEFGLGLALGACLQFLHLTPALIIHVNPANGAISSIPLSGPFEYIYNFALVPFLVAATSNALNLHDGMDGLAGGTSFFFLACLIFMLLSSGNPVLAWTATAAGAALLSFLIYNRYPAKVFMGDTGSLFLGSLFAGLIAASGLIFWFIPLAIIYIVETLSVIAQVVYFKLSKPYVPEKKMGSLALFLYKLSHKLPGEGKRLFRMAPIHHHFEAVAADRGIKEWQVVACFWLAQGLISAFCAFLFTS